MRGSILGLLLLSVGSFLAQPARGADSEAKEKSKRIAQAVKIFSPLAQSGVKEYKVSGQGVEEMMLSLAYAADEVSEESEFNWVGNSSDAWEADSMTWGSTTMKGAYAYITELESQYEEFLDEPANAKEKAKVLKNIQKAKDNFKLLLGSGVQFGVAPLGAVQCGVTFAALVFLDPHSGKAYVFAREGSGC